MFQSLKALYDVCGLFLFTLVSIGRDCAVHWRGGLGVCLAAEPCPQTLLQNHLDVFFFLFAVIIKNAPQLKTVDAALLLHLSGQDNTLRGEKKSSLSWMVLPLLNALIHSI